MNTSTFQFSIGLGSLISGLAANYSGLHSSMCFGAAIPVSAFFVVLAVGRMDRR